MDSKRSGIFGFLGGLMAGSQIEKITSSIGCGMVLLLVSFLAIVYSVNGIREDSQIVNNLELISATTVDSDNRGLVKAYGKLTTNQDTLNITIPKVECINNDCDFAVSIDELKFDDLLYYSISYQRYEVVREVKETGTNTDSVSEEVTYSYEWVEKDSKERWAEQIMIGDFSLEPEDSRLMIDFSEEEILDVVISGVEELETYGRTNLPEEIGNTRVILKYIPLDETEYIIVGEQKGNSIDGGSIFILTDRSDAELVDSLRSGESFIRWTARFFAWVLLTFALTMMLSPILTFTDFIPVAGKLARRIATIISAVISFIIILATVFVLNYWFICFAGIILIVLLIIALLFVQIKNKQENKVQETQIEEQN